jgi:hypothetical protein
MPCLHCNSTSTTERPDRTALYDFGLSIVHRSVLIGGISEAPPEESRRCATPYRSSLRMWST